MPEASMVMTLVTVLSEAALEFTADLLHQGNIHLVVQEAVHLQHIAGLYNAVLNDSLF